MLKLFAINIIISLLACNMTFAVIGPKQNNRYEGRADSLRKERLNPKAGDSIQKSSLDNMPVVKGSATDSSSPMPKVEPEKNQHMPVKELSDTTHKK